MLGLLKAAFAGDLAEVQRLIRGGASVREVDDFGRNALMGATIFGHIPVVQWLLNTADASITDTDQMGCTVFSLAAKCGKHSTVQWLLQEGGANITDVTMELNDLTGELESRSVWDSILDNPMFSFDVPALEPDFTSLLQIMVLLDDAPTNFVTKLLGHDAAIVFRIVFPGQRIRALRPSYLEQQEASIDTHCPLPGVLLAIVTAYAEPTAEDMWTDWIHWM
jgi:hypothetical protein